MILSWPHSPPCRLFDANNVELTHVTWCETEVGLIEEYVVDDQGHYAVDEQRGCLLRRKRKVPAPIRVEKDGGPDNGILGTGLSR